MYWIGICDDEKIYREEIKECIRRYCVEKRIVNYEIFEYTSGEELVDNSDLDILFLDVQMKDIDGIHVKEKLESERSRTKIIFVSSHPESMYEAFGANVMGFLKKPIDYRQFCKKTDKAIDICATDARYIFYNEYGISRKLHINDIVYIESLGRYKEIHIAGESKVLLSEKSMRDYRNELSKDFGMCYRSYLVNYKYVMEVEEEVVLEDGKVLPISRRYRATFIERFKKSIWERTEDTHV